LPLPSPRLLAGRCPLALRALPAPLALRRRRRRRRLRTWRRRHRRRRQVHCWLPAQTARPGCRAETLWRAVL
jgi:hypothetical protein